MSLAALLNRACTVTTRDAGGEDEYGDTTYTETETDTVCYLEQSEADEDTVNADTQAQTWKVLLPADTTISGSDHVTVGVLELEVQGPPWPVYNPRTEQVSHIECTARMVAGTEAEEGS